MYKSLLLPIMAGAFVIAPAAATPIARDSTGEDLTVWPLEPSQFDDDYPPPHNESENALESLLQKRGEGDFRLFRRHFYTRSCGPLGENCVDASLDHISIHTSCNGGGCGAETWRETDPDEDLCGKGINVCGKNYAMRYTRESPSCMKLKHFLRSTRDGLYHGETYAELVDSDEKKVGMCYVDTKRGYAKSCSMWGATDFWSQIQCFFD